MFLKEQSMLEISEIFNRYIEMVIEVVDWINCNFESEPFDISISGLGGWFNFNPSAPEGEQGPFGHRWQDLLDVYDKECYSYLEAIRESVLENGLQITGDQHQNSDHGVPLFNDNTRNDT